MIYDGIEFTSPNDLGKVVGTRRDGRKMIIIREFGVEKLTVALDPRNTKIEILARSPRKIIDLRQVKYIIKRRKRNELCFNGSAEGAVE